MEPGYRPWVAWQAWLDGDDFDFETLAETFGVDGDPTVHRPEPGQCYIEATAMGAPPDQPDFDAARAAVHRLVGLARVMHTNFQPVRLAGRYTSAEGASLVTVTPASARSRARVGVPTVLVDGVPVPPAPPPGPRYLALADREPDIADALRMLGQADADPDWYDLYKVLEIVQNANGGTTGIAAAGWATKSQMETFTKSANHPGVSGDAARHARMKGTPRQDGMTLLEGKTFIISVIARWLRSLATP